MLGLLGINDFWIWLVYLLCLGSALLCVVYGILNWNRGEEPAEPEDAAWAADEKKVEEQL